MTTNKEKMLHAVLDDKELQIKYDYDKSEYEDMYMALNSNVVVVGAVARFIKNFNGLDDKSEYRKVYQTVFNYINSNLLNQYFVNICPIF